MLVGTSDEERLRLLACRNQVLHRAAQKLPAALAISALAVTLAERAAGAGGSAGASSGLPSVWVRPFLP